MSMRLFVRSPRYLWLGAYLALNAVYFGVILAKNTLFGETNALDIAPATPITFVFTMLSLSYLLVTGFYFHVVERIKLPRLAQLRPEAWYADKIGLALLLLQLLFILYFTLAGTHLAGSTAKDDSILSQLWVLIPVDVFFYIYYGCYRESRYFRRNLLVWVVSNVLRGWSGVLLTIIFMESCRLIRRGKLRWKHVLIAVPAVLVGYPVIYFGKIFIRFYSFESSAGLDGFFSIFEKIDLGEAMLIAVSQIADRLQLLSSSIALYQISPDIHDQLIKAEIYPFWMEGIHGLALDRILGSAAKLNLGQAIAMFLDPLSIDVNWNANPTLIGWLFVMPEYFPLLILYVLTLATLTLVMTRAITRTEESIDMVWYMWLVMLIPGWFGAFFLFFYGLFIFFLLRWALNYVAQVSAERSEVTNAVG